MFTKTIDIDKETADLKELLSLIASGAVVVITEGDLPVARLIPYGSRIGGLHQGAISTSEDFDDPLPDNFWTQEA